MNLEDLWMPPHVPGGDVKISAEETDAEFDVYCQKYGNREGIRRFMMGHGASVERDYDAMAKRVNTVLYRRLSSCVSGSAEYVSKFSWPSRCLMMRCGPVSGRSFRMNYRMSTDVWRVGRHDEIDGWRAIVSVVLSEEDM